MSGSGSAPGSASGSHASESSGSGAPALPRRIDPDIEPGCLEDGLNQMVRDSEMDKGAIIEQYYDELTSEFSFGAKYISDDVGKGAFCTAPIAKDDIVLWERHMVGIQHLENTESCRACAQCLRLLGPLEDAMGHVSESGTSLDLSHISTDLATLMPYAFPDARPCSGGCSAIFCSEKCEERYGSHHQVLCPGSDFGSSALAGFYAHAVETNEIFLMAAQIMAMILVGYREDAGDLSRVMLPFDMFRKAPWWEVITSPDEDDVSTDDFRKAIRDMCEDSIAHLRAGLLTPEEEEDEAISTVFSVRFYAALIGMFEMNNLAVLVPSPWPIFIGKVQELPDEEGDPILDLLTEAEWDKLQDDVEGAGLFSVQAVLNHSCEPNCEARKQDGDPDGTTYLYAVRDIAVGEELTQSYVDESLTLAERAEHLREYCFVCLCPRCVREREFGDDPRPEGSSDDGGDSDETSDDAA